MQGELDKPKDCPFDSFVVKLTGICVLLQGNDLKNGAAGN